MNLDRLVDMIMRQIVRRGVNSGINAGMNVAGKTVDSVKRRTRAPKNERAKNRQTRDRGQDEG